MGAFAKSLSLALVPLVATCTVSPVASTSMHRRPGSTDLVLPFFHQPERCHNGFDDDGDGLVDCADPDCASDSACSPIDPSACAAECDRPECANLPRCQVDWCLTPGYDAGQELPVDVEMDQVPWFGQPLEWHGVQTYYGDVWAIGWTAPHDGEYVFDTTGSFDPAFLMLVDDPCPQDEIPPERKERGTAVHPLEPEIGLYRLHGGEHVLAVFMSSDDTTNTGFVLRIRERAAHESDCRDGIDDDVDGEADCADDDCRSDPRCDGLACADADLGTSPTVDAIASSPAHLGEWASASFVWTAPSAGRYVFETDPQNSRCASLAVHDGKCGGRALATLEPFCILDDECTQDPAMLGLTLEAGQRVVVDVGTMSSEVRLQIRPWSGEGVYACYEGTAFW